MGYYIFVERLLKGEPITVFGDGNQLRGNTYVADIVRATMLAHEKFQAGTVYNIGGSEEISANQVIGLLEEITGKKAVVEHGPPRPGEQRRALADTSLARERLGFVPNMPLPFHLFRQAFSQRDGT